MKQLTLLFLFTSQLLFAQSELIDQTINKIQFEQDSVKSVFKWVTANIKYDVQKLKSIEKGSSVNNSSKYKTKEAYKNHLLSKVIKQKKGVCQDYSLLFDALLKKLGYQSFVIQGYTKNKKGQINRKVGHTWNIVQVNGVWKLYDPTWGAGHVVDGKRFVQAYGEEWYEVSPTEMLKTHMPIDPMWQLLEKPLTYDDFAKSKTTSSSTETYDYNQLINEYAQLDKKEQMRKQVSRSEAMGEGIRLVGKWRRMKTKYVGLYGIISQQDALEEANESANNSVELFNAYIKAKNKQFKQRKYDITYARQKLEQAEAEVSSAYHTFQSLDIEDKKAIISINKAKRFCERMLKNINTELLWLDNYEGR